MGREEALPAKIHYLANRALGWPARPEVHNPPARLRDREMHNRFYNNRYYGWIGKGRRQRPAARVASCAVSRQVAVENQGTNSKLAPARKGDDFQQYEAILRAKQDILTLSADVIKAPGQAMMFQYWSRLPHQMM